jgi:hypothetical protein
MDYRIAGSWIAGLQDHGIPPTVTTAKNWSNDPHPESKAGAE